MNSRVEIYQDLGLDPRQEPIPQGLRRHIRRVLAAVPSPTWSRLVIAQEERKVLEEARLEELKSRQAQQTLQKEAEQKRKEQAERAKIIQRMTELEDLVYGYHPDMGPSGEYYSSAAELHLLEWKIAATQVEKESCLGQLKRLVMFSPAANEYLHEVIESQNGGSTTRFRALQASVLTEDEVVEFRKISSRPSYTLWL